ncbi:MAG: hypothetical protein E7315_00270 [Clostridiales bacterium]|nr:hypothetical protein [Clostridiales bacterium]
MLNYLKVFVVGFGMVFVILVLLIGVLAIMRLMMGIKTPKAKAEPKPKKEVNVAREATPAPTPVAVSGEDDEIAAVISAVLMMLSAEGEATGKKLVLKSIKACDTVKTVRRRSAWGDMARREQMNNF